MITTQYGSEVKIIGRKGDGWALVRRVSDGAIREWHVSRLNGETKDDFATLCDVLYGDVVSNIDAPRGSRAITWRPA